MGRGAAAIVCTGLQKGLRLCWRCGVPPWFLLPDTIFLPTYCSRVGKDPHALAFVVGSTDVVPTDTAEILGLVDKSTIKVYEAPRTASLGRQMVREEAANFRRFR